MMRRADEHRDADSATLQRRDRAGHARPAPCATYASRCCLAWLLLTAMGAGTAVAQSKAEAKYVGRPLTDVLREMQAGGVKLVYSSELVRPDLRVVAEPRARAPRSRRRPGSVAPRPTPRASPPSPAELVNLGAHCSTQGGVSTALGRASSIGCSTTTPSTAGPRQMPAPR